MQRTIITILLASGFSLPLLAAEQSPHNGLVTDFWRAESGEAREAAGRLLVENAADVSMLYRWFKNGPDYAADVSRGYQEAVREASDGTSFPYVMLVPDSYESTNSYPVEFMLHGGVSRPYPEEPGSWWRRGFDSLRSEEKITVVPAAWNDAFWWFPNQAENLHAILRDVKRDYNVEDNQVYLTGISDGGTGAYFFAFKQNTDWAAFMPFIAHPGVLRNAASGGGYQLYFENLMAKPLYIVNGEEDPLYPAASLSSFIGVLREADINHVFKAIEGGGHNTRWLPDETQAIEQFKVDNPRDPLPDSVQWVTDSTVRFNRSHWLIIDELARDNQPGIVQVTRDGNIINVDTTSVNAFTLLLSPEEIDFSRPVAIYINGSLRRSESLRQDPQTLLKWAARDLDKSMLFTAELNLRVGGE